MPTDEVLALLIAARDRLNRAIEALQRAAKPAPAGLEGTTETLAPSTEVGSSTLAGQERILISRALETAGDNQSAAARILGISRDSLRYKVKKHNLGTPRSS